MVNLGSYHFLWLYIEYMEFTYVHVYIYIYIQYIHIYHICICKCPYTRETTNQIKLCISPLYPHDITIFGKNGCHRQIWSSIIGVMGLIDADRGCHDCHITSLSVCVCVCVCVIVFSKSTKKKHIVSCSRCGSFLHLCLVFTASEKPKTFQESITKTEDEPATVVPPQPG